GLDELAEKPVELERLLALDRAGAHGAEQLRAQPSEVPRAELALLLASAHTPLVPARAVAKRLRAKELPEHVLENAAVAQVLALARRIGPQARREAHCGAPAVGSGRHRHLARLPILDALDGERLAPGQPQRGRGLALAELEGQDPHPDQVRAVDPLVGLGQHSPYAEEQRPLRRPVAR